MRRFLTLVLMLGLAAPVGISITGCVRNPAAKYCPVTSGYGEPITAVTSIIMQPQIGGISLAYGQTRQASAPSAFTCTGSGASVSSSQYAYGTSNNQLVDISPSGNICAGTWNRNTGGGIADYTICYPPNPVPSTGSLPYSIAYITASADSVTSNPVEVFVHAPVTSVSLVVPSNTSGTQQCYSQGETAQLDAQACFEGSDGKQHLLCAPPGTTTLACPLPSGMNLSQIPDCSNAIGTLSFSVGSSQIASINATTNVITAEQPGTTAITASIAGSGSSAGYFSTCPPASIKVALANGATTGNITQGVQQNLTTTVTDTAGNPITGLTLEYQSTNPIDITAGTGGAVSPRYPGAASITAICQPATCNPAPINELGLNGTGLPLSSNPVTVTTPGVTSNYVWFSSPGNSQYFVPVDLLTGTIGSTVRLPYVPNSMLMDQTGTSLYFGSARELMIYSASSNTITKQDSTAPGVVLAVSPTNSQVLINDQARHLFYLYNATGGGASTFGGMGEAAAWTPDGQTLYIVDNAELNSPAGCSNGELITGHTDTLYVYNLNTGWSTYPLPPSPLPPDALPTCNTEPNTAPVLTVPSQPNIVGPLTGQAPAVTIPGVGAYMRGTPTTANTWCPSGTVGGTLSYFPQGDPGEAVQSDSLAATVDGDHILTSAWDATGAGSQTGTLTIGDINVQIPTSACPISTSATGVQTLSPLIIKHSTPPFNILPVANLANVVSVDQVVTGPLPVTNSSTTVSSNSLAFVTYSASAAPTSGNALLPYYVPGSGSAAGTVGYVTLKTPSGSPSVIAPIAGAFSPDDNFFFVSTTGDNEIHFISIPTNVSGSNSPTDSQQISPNLPACTPVSAGGLDAGCVYPGSSTIVPATAIAVVPRSTT
jgi:trimeric autotransporter adhesin